MSTSELSVYAHFLWVQTCETLCIMWKKTSCLIQILQQLQTSLSEHCEESSIFKLLKLKAETWKDN